MFTEENSVAEFRMSGIGGFRWEAVSGELWLWELKGEAGAREHSGSPISTTPAPATDTDCAHMYTLHPHVQCF